LHITYARDFKVLRQVAEQAYRLGATLRAEVDENKDLADAFEAGMLLSTGAFMRDLARYMRFQSELLPGSAAMEDFLSLSAIAGTSRQFRFGRLLTAAIRKFSDSSSRVQVEELPTLTDSSRERLHTYLRKFPELWPSQQDAIRRGLLDPAQKYFIVALPTSSGKTLCGELAIIQELTDKPSAVCFYVVPTRALVTEKSQELEHKLSDFGLVVAGATGALQRDEIETSLLANARVIVCTPEKLDLLIRHDDESLSKASLFIIDEMQMVADRDRGLGLEFAVIKLLLLKPDSRILLLSATLPNSEDFGRWLSRKTAVSSIDWRPTRQIFGEIAFRRLKPRGSRLEIGIYDISGEFDGLQIPLRDYPRQPSSILERVIWAAEIFCVKGPVLVFCMTKPRCEEIVERIVDYRSDQEVSYVKSPAIEKLQMKVKREIAEDFLLSRALGVRVAYHHADLPPRIRIDLEELIAAGELDAVFSTTTLAEGVNLPISTVIFEDWMTRGDARVGRKPEALELSKFRNIAGRAGRAGKEAEGLVMFLEPGRKPIRVSDGQEVSPLDYFVRSEYPPIESRFLEIVRSYRLPDDAALDRAWEDGDRIFVPEVRRALRQFSLAVLHTMEVLYLDDDAVIDSVIDHSLLAAQEPEEKDRARAWFGTWVRFYRRVDLEREELRIIAMQVGLPLRAISGLYERVSAMPELLGLFGVEGGEQLVLSDEQIEAVADTVTAIEELDWEPEQAPHDQLLSSWLKGASIQQLAEEYVPSLSTRTRPLERTCNYTTQQLSNTGAWGTYALARVLELILGEDSLSSMAKRLPLLAYFGVCTIPATVICLMGVERIDALRLGSAFLADGNVEYSTSLIRSWTREIGVDRLTQILRGPDDRELDEDTFKVLGIA
jgi:superfamily II DNA/RNA helicase